MIMLPPLPDDDPYRKIRVDERKKRLFQEICRVQPITRKRLVDRFHLRPATVSMIVLDLINNGLVREGKAIDPNRQGRPEISLHVATDRLAVIVIYVVSNEIRGTLISLGGIRLDDSVSDLSNAIAENKDITEAFIALIDNLSLNKPEATEIIGISFSLPGIIDEAGRRWIFSTRWPKMSNFCFEQIQQYSGFHVNVARSLHSELRARLVRRHEESKGGLLIVHWGYGIGASYAYDGVVLQSDLAGFGEVGHWQVGINYQGKCYCNKTGCLETEAALWALLPKIRSKYGEVPSDEQEVGVFLENANLELIPELRLASDLMIQAIYNMYMMLFPHKLVITGPFMRNPEISEYVQNALKKMTPVYLQNNLNIHVARLNTDDEIIGAASPLFLLEVEKICG